MRGARTFAPLTRNPGTGESKIAESQGFGERWMPPRKVAYEDSMRATHPHLADQFDLTRNGDLRPESIKAGTGFMLHWKCDEGPDHEWAAKGNNRVYKSGCPFCAGKRPSVTNSVASLHPAIASELHPTKNEEGVTADQLTEGTSKPVWWLCGACRREWKEPVRNRTESGKTMCKTCRPSDVGKKYRKPISETHPKAAAFWDYAKNELTPADMTSGSGKKVHWKCDKGPDHEWLQSVNKRVNSRIECLVCSGHRIVGSNCLAATQPELAAQWDYTKNSDEFSPETIGEGSGETIHWKCDKGPDHEWPQIVAMRLKAPGCPFCSSRRLSITNSLATRPDLAAEWHPTKNGDLTPDDVTAGAAERRWWLCGDCEHEWETSPSLRLRQETGCALCNRGWSVRKIRAFLKSLLESGQYKSMTPAEMWVLFQQNGLIAGSNSKRDDFVKALGTKRLDPDDLEDFVNGDGDSEIDHLIEEGADAGDFIEAQDEVADDIDPSEIEEDDFEPGLPDCSVADALDVLESSVWASDDVEAMEFLQASAVAKMWLKAYSNPEAALAEASEPREHEYSERSRQQFHSELTEAISLEMPDGYDFRIDGELAEPFLMQRHVAVLVRENRRVGNWSGTGAGKTLSAAVASRVVEAEVTVVCCPNATVEGWVDAISNAFPAARIATKTLNPVWVYGDGPRYLIVNYEKFQQPNSEADVKALTEWLAIDMVVVDEIHYTKKRKDDDASKRRRLVNGLIASADEAKRERDGSGLHVLGMTATPVINNLREGISLIEMVTGIKHDDLSAATNIPNAMSVYQKLKTLGPRRMPDYPKPADSQPTIDISHRRDEIVTLTAGGKSAFMLPLEQLMLEEKLGAITEAIKPGTLIYTEYVSGMVEPIRAAVAEAGFSVGVCTGQNKTGLQPFKDGKLDVLIGSSTIGTGVDGLQHVASRLIIACAPWTSAAYEQLVGRLVRTGQQEPVDIIFPLTYIDTEEGEWSYDRGNRLNRIRYKKTIADAAVDGIVPEGALRTPAQAFKDATAWLQRLTEGDISAAIQRRIITVPLSGDRVEVARRLRSYGDFAKMNNRWNSSGSAKTHERLKADPEEWENYHTLYQQARETWTWTPYKKLASIIGKGSKHRVVADFGCGEDLLGQKLRRKGFTVHSYDHIAVTDDVIAVDVGEGVPLDDGEIDVAVFSLSLMGANNGDYLREAARVLAFDGRLHIVEAASRLDRVDDVKGSLSRLGFHLVSVSSHGVPEFTHIQALRTDAVPVTEFDFL